MLDPQLLNLLCCPETHQAVRLAEPALLDQLNERIAARALKTCAGRVVAEQLTAGLVREDGKVVYPVRNGIPVMLVEEGLQSD